MAWRFDNKQKNNKNINDEIKTMKSKFHILPLEEFKAHLWIASHTER